MYRDSWYSNMLYIPSVTLIPASRAYAPSFSGDSFFVFKVIHYSNDLILFLGATDCWLLTTAASSAAAASLHDADEYIMFYVNSSCRVIYTLTRDIMHSPAQPNIVRMFLLPWST